jgi:hypothetical protein
MWTVLDNLKPLRFHDYTSITIHDVFKIELPFDTYIKLENRFVRKFKKAGIKCSQSNKSVFEVEFDGLLLFYGFYDNHFSVGLGCKSSRTDGIKSPHREGFTYFGRTY